MRAVLTFVILTLAATVPGVARADEASEAQLQYELGVELYRQRRFAEAVERFIASNRLVPNANVVLNIAQTYQLMNRPVEAYNWYETCLLTFQLDADQRERAEDSRDRLGSEVAIVHVRTEPAGALLYVDRVELGSVGVSPRRVAVEPGPHLVIARMQGHHEASKQLELVRGQLQPFGLELRPMVGALHVNVTPAGASVRLSGSTEPLGASPLRAQLPVGRHEIVIELAGHVPQNRAVEVRAEEATTLDVTLAQDRSTMAILSVLGSPSGAVVHLNDEPVGEVPLTLGALEPGPRRVRIDAEGRRPWSSPLVLEAGSATRVEVDLAEERSGPWKGWRWMGYGGGGAAVLTGVSLAIAARVGRQRFFDDDNPTRQHLDAVHRRNVAADVFLWTGLAVVGATLLWDLLRPAPKSSTGRITIDR
jgi:outer membrane receptor for ferrienterochelin and colicins